MEEVSFQFYVAGVQFHQAKQVLHLMQVGEKLEMEPEPNNEFDQNAVKLLYDGVMIGYVPGKISADVSAFLEYADPIATITAVDSRAKTWEQIEVEIKEVGEDAEAV